MVIKYKIKGGGTMKTWNNPEVWSLDAQSTEAGIRGVSSDGVWLEHLNDQGVGDAIVIGTSGQTPSKGWQKVPNGTKL